MAICGFRSKTLPTLLKYNGSKRWALHILHCTTPPAHTYGTFNSWLGQMCASYNIWWVQISNTIGPLWPTRCLLLTALRSNSWVNELKAQNLNCYVQYIIKYPLHSETTKQKWNRISDWCVGFAASTLLVHLKAPLSLPYPPLMQSIARIWVRQLTTAQFPAVGPVVDTPLELLSTTTAGQLRMVVWSPTLLHSVYLYI